MDHKGGDLQRIILFLLPPPCVRGEGSGGGGSGGCVRNGGA